MEEVLPFSRVYVTNILGAILIGTVCIGIILSSKDITGGNLYTKCFSNFNAIYIYDKWNGCKYIFSKS